MLAAVLPYSLALLLPDEALFEAVAEDGAVEWVGAAAWMLAGLLFFRTLLSERGGEAGRPHRFWSGTLALMCVLAAGEEISWGQRVFGYETPPLVAESNLQREMNFHNLTFLDGRVSVSAEGRVKKEGLAAWLSFARLGMLIWGGFLIALPIAYRLFGAVRTLVDRLRFPVPPLIVPALCIASYATSRLLFDSAASIDGDAAMIRIAADETHETVVAVLFLVAAAAIHRRGRVPDRADRAR